MAEENIRQEFRLKNIDKTKNYFLEEKEQNELISRKHIDHFPILASTITGCISASDFASFIGIPIGMTSSVIELKISAITARIKKYKSIIKKTKKKHDKIVFFTKSELDKKEVLISKASIYSIIRIDSIDSVMMKLF